MKWLDAAKLATWADRITARQILPALIGQLVRASSADISSFRFPAGDSAQIHGWDGQLIAEPDGPYKAYVPEGSSVWEFGVTKSAKSKAEADYEKRTNDVNPGIIRAETTFVFVTPRTWESHGDWSKAKKDSGVWKDVRVLDGVDLEEWMNLCPAAAASFARDNGFAPEIGALSVDEFWDLYSRQFQPPISEAVLLAGRNPQRQEIQNALVSGRGIQRCKGDSLEEVLGFLCATIRSADEGVQAFLKARTLILQTEEAARRLQNSPNLLFAVRGSAKESAGMLADRHRVIVPVGRDDIRSASAIALLRPTAQEMGEALQTIGVSPERAPQLAHECGKSVTVLARRIPSGDPSPCTWRDDAGLLGALLAGAWDQALETDQAIITALVGVPRYQDAESTFRGYLKRADGPLELVGSVWAVRAPVDMFVQVSHLLHRNHWSALQTAVNAVLAERNPALDQIPEERMNAPLRGQGLTHSSWLRDGLATTLLILSALGEQNDIEVDGRSPQAFVNGLVAGLPGLQEDYRVIASLSHQLPMLMEAAPDPLLLALEHLLEGESQKLKPIFQDRKDQYSPWTSSPHTGLLWALEVVGRDPEYLQRASSILMQLERIDPGGTLSNRPIGSLRHLFSVWHPATNASHEMRIAVLEQLTTLDDYVAWKLVVGLIPEQGALQFETPRPLFKELGASEREKLTYPILYKCLTWIAGKAIQLAGTDEKRWIGLIEKLHHLPPGDRETVTAALGRAVSEMSEEGRLSVWQSLSKLTRRHRAYQSAKWALSEDQLLALEIIEDRISPEDLGTQDQYLFTEQLPDIRMVDHNRVWEQIDGLRAEVVRKLLTAGGIESVVSFASKVEAPRYVGSSLGTVEQTPEALLLAVKLANSLPKASPGFVSSLSSAAFVRFGVHWSTLVRDALQSGYISQAELPDLVEWWPHQTDTWNWVAQFGPQAVESYWKNKRAWGIKASGDELALAVNRYLEFDRPEYVVDALGLEADKISEKQWYAILSAYEARLTEAPELLRGQSAAYHIQQIFKSLQKRADISIEELAFLEYRYLPLLRELLSDVDPNSALDRYLAQKPELYVDVIKVVFRPASERDQPRPDPTPEESAKARNGFILLESFSYIPGRAGDVIDSAYLTNWVKTVQALAKDVDRIDVAEQCIGKVLVHAPIDPEDLIWPHKAIRDGLEVWQASHIEKGIYIAKANARGVTSRGPFDGGAQERVLATELRTEASRLSKWPRTRQIFVNLAEHYEAQARLEDLEADQLRMRE